MNTYQLIVVAAIKLGIPSVLSYLAFKAAYLTNEPLRIAALTFIVAVIITHFTMENELKYFN